MRSCTFFGHRQCPESIDKMLRDAVSVLIKECGVDMFYVGNQGQFDALVRRTLRDMKREFPHIHYAVVLAYMPGKQSEYGDYTDTMLPEGIEVVHPRYAISWRNKWMLERSDFVIAYVTHRWGGAAKYYDKALAEQKCVINIGAE